MRSVPPPSVVFTQVSLSAWNSGELEEADNQGDDSGSLNKQSPVHFRPERFDHGIGGSFEGGDIDLEIGYVGFGSHGVIVGQRINHGIGLEFANGLTNVAQSIESQPRLTGPLDRARR